MLIAGLEVLLLVVNVALIRHNERLLKEIRKCNYDLASALSLAAQGRYRDAETSARRWAGRMRAHMAGEAYHRPDEQPASPNDDDWQGRFAP